MNDVADENADRPPLVDIGANLAHDSFDADRDEVLQRARTAGVTRIVVTGSSVDSSRQALELARSDPQSLRATAGVHPHHAADYDDSAENTLRELLADPLVTAAGECGLDYFRNFSPVEAQRIAFRRQLELAVDQCLPVFLHQRDAHDDFLDILSPYVERLPAAVAHCFTGDAAMLDAYLELDLYIGITGWICDERRGQGLKSIVSRIPLDRLMIETDAPYLLPRTLRPTPGTRRNEPAWLTEVLRVVAEASGRSESAVAAATTANARGFFGFA
ncbi:MAG: TatD family hydrolase [Woeseiaceae bacterium]|nr:TatD family hydrolase [Woeseiaceae bacterium]